ncbi:MAG: cation:proton antiporter [Candidatus Aenigmarchaeota archaeon]|nr:cation:proton antiporter [Candidatus Aenigmarchaeota archaeon]
MPFDVPGLMVIAGLTIIIGYAGSIIFEKTKIPDVLWLMLFGYLVSAFRIIDTSFFFSISGFLASVALFMILFDAGLNINFYQMVRQFSRSMLLSVFTTAFTIAAVTGVCMFFGLGFLPSLLIGCLLAGTSSAIVVPLVTKLKIRGNIRTVIGFESIFSDPMVIVLSLAVMGIMTGGMIGNPVSSVLSVFSVGAMLGLVAGIIWLFVLDYLKGRQFDYMLTLGALLLLYTFTEYAGGSGAIAALLFGIVLGNASTFSEILKTQRKFTVNHLLKNFQSEISFFVRSFFFVYIGMVVSLDQETLIIGHAVTLAVIMARFLAVDASTIGEKLSAYEKNIMRIMVPRDFIPVLLTQLPILYTIPNTGMFSKVVMNVVFLSIVYTTLMVLILPKQEEQNLMKNNKNKK